jgi:LPS sulfotransferase NodH
MPPPRKSRILCIVAGQRSGTTALQSALAGAGEFKNFREIFHTTDLSSGSFLPYIEERQVSLSSLSINDNAQNLAHQYIDFLLDTSFPKAPLIDVKLNSWSILNPFWHYPHQVPLFMKALMEHGAYFLAIRRQNLADQIVSELIARHANKWHELTEGDVASAFSVNIDVVRNQARLIIESENFLFNILKSRGCVSHAYYENLFVGNNVNPEILGVINQEFEMHLENASPSIKKSLIDKSAVVVNMEEARSAVDHVLKRISRIDM